MGLQSICSRKSKQHGGSIAEYVMAVFVGSIITVFTITLVVHSGRTFAGLANYADLNSSSIAAIDRMTTEIRNSSGLLSFDPQQIVLEVATNKPPVTYAYSAADRTLIRKEGDKAPSVILTECESVDFFIYEPVVESNSLALAITTVATNAKAIGANWVCTRSILGRKVNNDSPRTAVVVMRKP